MAWVTFALSLLHICVGFILPLGALTVLCSQWLWKTKAANSLLLPLWWSPQHLPGGARCSSGKDRIRISTFSPWSQTISCCPEVWISDPCGQSCGGGGSCCCQWRDEKQPGDSDCSCHNNHFIAKCLSALVIGPNKVITLLSSLLGLQPVSLVPRGHTCPWGSHTSTQISTGTAGSPAHLL